MKHMAVSAPVTTAPALLTIEDLSVTFRTDSGPLPALDSISLEVHPGETLAVVGESGSGKSVLSLAIMGLLPPTARLTAGRMEFDGRDLTGLGRAELRSLRGRDMAMIFQEPATALNPVQRIGDQLVEAIRLHDDMPVAKARTRAVEALAATGIPSPDLRARAYPQELSGGMRQRALIAMALIHRPRLLIADEPTTALDVTVQAQIVDLLNDLQAELGLAIILITHDLGVVAGLCRDVAVMYAGRIVETGPIDALFAAPAHPYTQGLLRSTPTLEASERRLVAIPGAPPRLIDPPQGCAFLPRCPIGDEGCRRLPPLGATAAGTRAACWKAGTDAWAGVPETAAGRTA